MLKLIALGLVLYYVVFPLLRFLLKGYVITQVHKKMSEHDIRSRQSASKARKEGSIDVDYVPPKAKAKTDNVGGDYVPYEEIKE
jgi:hypothetical protein